MILPFSVVASVIFFVVVFLCKDLSAQTNEIPETPCPDVFQYKRHGSRNVGIITIKDVSFGRTTVAIELSQQGYMELDNSGQLSLNFNKDKIYQYINAGTPFTYRVDFPLEYVVPRVTSIKLNDFQICFGQPYGTPSTNMKLVHTLNTYSPVKKSVADQNAWNRSRSYFNEGSSPGANLPEFLKFSPSFARQMSTYTSSAFDQPSYTKPSYTPQSDSSNLPEFLKFSSSIMRQRTSNPSPPLDQPSYTQPISYTQSPYTQPPHTPAFLNIKPPYPQNTVSPGTRNPPPIFVPSTETERPTFTIPAETMPITPVGINIRNPEAAPSTENPIASTDLATFDHINRVCGRENLNSDVKRLNVRGQVISKSRFPWIVAIYKRKDDGNDDDELDFRCGGSLISTRTVVSAAHCFYVGLRQIQPEEIVISMGRHNLTDWEDANNIDANQVVLHPDYRPTQTNFDADLAIIRFKASVTFTNVVKPICMWQGNKDPREIVGMSGVIVGWGSDGRRKTTTVPTLVNATVVAEITCIRSNFKFVSLTSKRTICAGNADGSGPCMGDSGNGLMIRNRNKWMLRGTVSAAPDSPIRRCVLDDYAIYSDIAMFVEWIESNMLL